jgi:tRNA(Ile)-lysidine synthase
MLTEFQKTLADKYDLLPNQKLLLAISGGIDSMVLLNLAVKSKLNFAVAHCNFNLRDKESDKDQKFITDYCQTNKIQLYLKSFDTNKYAAAKKTSIQIAARELRYQWFFELKETLRFNYIVTAHHLDDNLETFMINLLRGTGIEGLVGIQENKGVIRPLLHFSRAEIEKYAATEDIKWREDASNASDNYLRNKLRHHAIPLLKELNPEFLGAFQKTTDYLKEVQDFSKEVLNIILDKILEEKNNSIVLDIEKLKTYKNYKFILYNWLTDYGFSAWQDIYDLVDAQSGKCILSEKYTLLKNRNELILSKTKTIDADVVYPIEDGNTTIDFPISLTLTEVDSIPEEIGINEIFVDKSLLNFPMFVGKSKEGTYFYPFGMQGKKKKLSKFFKDMKLSLFEKENTWILYSDKQVVWVIGMRADERFKVTDCTTSILKIEFKPL